MISIGLALAALQAAPAADQQRAIVDAAASPIAFHFALARAQM
jgi:hypothetical protein